MTDRIKIEYAPGKFAPEHVFKLADEELNSQTITFKLFDVQNKLVKRDPADPNKVLSETVFFDQVRKGVDIPDSTGGNACGRTFPSWEGKKFSPAERQVQSKIANYYTYLIGEVTFPGQQPTLANFRMPSSIVKAWFNFQSNMPKDKAEWPSVLLELTAQAQQEKDQFTAVVFSIKQTGLTIDAEANKPVLKAINDFIQEHNSNIINKKVS